MSSLPAGRDLPEAVPLHEFTEPQRRFIELLAYPEQKKTMAEMSQELGVPVSTLYRWKKNPALVNAVNALAYHFLKTELPDVYRALAAKAKSGNTRAIEIILKYVGGYVERVEHGQATASVNIEIQNLTDEELQAMIQEKAKRLNVVDIPYTQE